MAEVPIDRGWAWMCVLGAGICSFVVVGGIKSLGILLVEIVQKFGASSATASLMMALVSVGVSIIAPLSTALGERFSYRLIIIVGGVLCAFAYFATAFAVNAAYVVAIFGTFTGAGFGCIAGTSLVVVGMYFNRRRSLANGLAVSGGSAGQLIIPMLMRFLLDNYGFTGGLIIFSGICLHIIPAALLMRPFSFYTHSKRNIENRPDCTGMERFSNNQHVGKQCEVPNDDRLDVDNSNNLGSPQEESDLNLNNLNDIYLDFIDDDANVESELDGIRLTTSPLELSTRTIQTESPVTGDGACVMEDYKSEDEECSEDLNDLSNLKQYLTQFRNNYQSNMLKHKDGDQNGPKDYVDAHNKSSRCIGRSFFRNDSVTSQLSLRSLDIAPLQSLPSCIEDDEEDEKMQPCSCPRDFFTTCCCCFIKITPKDQPLIQWNLFKNKLFILYVIAICLGNTGYMIACLYLPAHAEDIGMEQNHAAMLLSVMGIVDLVGRIGGGWFADLGYISRSNFLGLCLLLTGIATFICIPLFSPGGLLALSIVMGLFGGCSVSLQTVVLVDYLGASLLSASYGLSIMCQGFVNIILPTLLGVARDNFGSYAASYYICAGLMVLSGVAFTLEPCVRRWQEKTENKKTNLPLQSAVPPPPQIV